MRYNEPEFEEEGAEEYEGDFEFGEETQSYEGSEELDETEEMELASQLLEVSDEHELDQFIGKLLSRIKRAGGRLIRSGPGRALGGILKGAAKKALPAIGGVVGGYFGGQAGSQAGSQVAADAGRLFGLELEGLSEEDQEFEVARRFVRFAEEAARNLATSPAPAGANPEQAAKAAAINAAKRHAPGLICAGGREGGCPNCRGAQSGRWVRRGRHIIILNAKGGQQSRTQS